MLFAGAMIPGLVLVALLAPLGLLVRWGVLDPLGLVIPAVRKFAWERVSSLSINPDFRRRPPEGEFARMVFWQELGCSAWAIFLVASAWFYGARPLLIGIGVVSLVAVLDAARAEGVEISGDVYPYDFWQTTLTALFPDRDFSVAKARYALDHPLALSATLVFEQSYGTIDGDSASNVGGWQWAAGVGADAAGEVATENGFKTDAVQVGRGAHVAAGLQFGEAIIDRLAVVRHPFVAALCEQRRRPVSAK